MNKPGIDKQNISFSSIPLTGPLNSSSIRRLIILIPDVDSITAELAHEIWKLASPSGLDVLFFGICSNIREEPYLRRELVTMAAAIQDSRISVDIRIELGNDWIEIVRTILRSGDTLVCLSGQQEGLQHGSLSQVFNSNLGAPVYILSGLHSLTKSSRSDFFSQLVSWVGSIVIILGFFWIQVKIEQMPKDWAHTTLIYLSIFIEIGLIWLWNSLTA